MGIIGRLIGSGAFITAALAFLWIFGPRPTPVRADIYASLASSAGFLLPPGGEGSTLRHGKVLINGATFNYVLGHSRQSLDAVLSHYEKQFEARDAGGKTLSSATRLDTDGAGVVAGMHFGTIRHPSQMAERVGKFATSGRLGDLAQFHMISAYAQKGTVFIDFTPAADVTVQSLLPPVDKDAPGEDVQGIIRPANLQRLFTVEHGDERDWSRTLIYRAGDPRASVDAFRRSFASAGWSGNPVFEGQDVAHFTDGQRECFLAGSGSGASSVVILIQRNLSPRSTTR